MLIDYINENFLQAEPIFLSDLPFNSLEALRQEMKRLTDSGKLIRLHNGVYYKAYKTILGTEGKVSIQMYIEKKFIYKNNKVNGYITGIGLYNKYGFTSQIPSIIEVASNEASTKQRKIKVDNYNIIVYKPFATITNENVNELMFLDLMLNIDKYSEIRGKELVLKLKEMTKKLNLNFALIKNYLSLYPERIYKNLYEGGIMSELV